MNERPLKKGPFQKEISSSNISNHQFSRDSDTDVSFQVGMICRLFLWFNPKVGCSSLVISCHGTWRGPKKNRPPLYFSSEVPWDSLPPVKTNQNSFFVQKKSLPILSLYAWGFLGTIFWMRSFLLEPTRSLFCRLRATRTLPRTNIAQVCAQPKMIF